MRCELRKFFANYFRREVFCLIRDSKFQESTDAYDFLCNPKFIFFVNKYHLT